MGKIPALSCSYSSLISLFLADLGLNHSTVLDAENYSGVIYLQKHNFCFSIHKYTSTYKHCYTINTHVFDWIWLNIFQILWKPVSPLSATLDASMYPGQNKGLFPSSTFLRQVAMEAIRSWKFASGVGSFPWKQVLCSHTAKPLLASKAKQAALLFEPSGEEVQQALSNCFEFQRPIMWCLCFSTGSTVADVQSTFPSISVLLPCVIALCNIREVCTGSRVNAHSLLTKIECSALHYFWSHLLIKTR